MKLKNKKYQNSNFFKLRIPFIRNKYKMNGGGYVSHLLLFSFFLLELAYGKGTSSSSSSSSSSSASSSLNYDNSFSLSGSNNGGLSPLQYEHQQIMPKIMTRGQSYRAVIGDTIVLPCRVEDLGDNTLLWRRGSSVLTADKTMITKNQRYKLVDKYDLQIKIVEPQDAGDYNCQINDQENRDFVHTVEILVPPKVWSVPENGHVTARKGGTVTLECKASGNPVPSIRWTKKDPADEHRYIGEGSTLTLDRVERQNSGSYQCIAENGVREPAMSKVVLTVLSPPEITVDKSWVHAGEGYEARLVCTVYGEANPMMTWYQDSFLLEPTDRRIMEVKDNQHTLLIRNVQSSDFGNYSCVADNSLGRAKKYIEVSGRPAAAVFHSPLYSRTRDSYNLTWSIESAPSLEEIRLLYRKLMMNETYQHPGKWHDIILTPDAKSTESVHHRMTYTIRGLEQNSVYEAIVQAKNRYGWNEVSDIFQFYIQSSNLNNNHLEMEEQDMESLLHSTQYNSTKKLFQSNSLTIILSILLLHVVFSIKYDI